ncbi:TolC family protein [Ectopseudomonas oleovorans]|uniref:TolC family protein n=1 Tax=Ectopseudomonas oleovorans TaxID=301 RepID=A0AA42TYV8_ECTOL|nr:TolC family protein [Pseudomonas oleovorans]MDH1338778.1 TolC family protein [Pseudomonas oleovorans]MDH1493409.1 TolC family protein [Pseudomonas oleovorans]WGG20685.1 TolC family protein [Pseudomonas oleovorans]
MLRRLMLLAVLSGAGLAQAGPLPLDELFVGLDDSAQARAGQAQQDALAALRRQREAEAGWQWFASAGTGQYRELVTDDVRDDYYGRDLALGLRHPLLGTLQRQLQAVDAVELEQQRQRARAALQQAEQRLALRSAYADWWRAEQEMRWCADLQPAARSARERLEQRHREGWLLPSEARLLQGQWQALERRCQRAASVLETLRATVASLAGRPLDGHQHAVAEPLSSQVQPLSAWHRVLERHPRLQERQDELQHAERQRQSPWYSVFDSSISLAQSYEDRSGASKPGSGLVASLSLSAPFDPLEYGRDRRQEFQARQQAAVAGLEVEREQLLLALGQALHAQRSAIDELAVAREQLAVAEQAHREQRLRRDAELERGVQRELGAELERYSAGLQLIAAWHAAWLREAALRLFVGDDGALAGLLGVAQQQWQSSLPAGDWRQGVYLWDSRRLLQQNSRHSELRALRQAGMQRIYLGLSAAQVSDMQGLRQQLQASLVAAHGEGLQVALLLGDPDWLKAESRAGLLNLIGQLHGLPFDALHLDLEVEQLGWPVPDSRLQDWLDTLTAVASVNPWPLELSSHHRWFADPQPGQTCIPCALPQRGVGQVSLMIYTRNPERSAELVEQITQRWPALRFRLAQSVEPQLDAEESWAGTSARQLRQQIELWRQRLQPQGVTGIDWQEWTYYPN